MSNIEPTRIGAADQIRSERGTSRDVRRNAVRDLHKFVEGRREHAVRGLLDLTSFAGRSDGGTEQGYV